MTIRAKIYAAIVLSVIGPLATIGVALYGMGQLGDRFDQVEERSSDQALALQLKFGVTDVNGWQTAYGYDNGRSRPRFDASVASFRAGLARADRTLVDAPERALLERIRTRLDAFMALDRQAYAALRAGREARTRAIFLGPEIGNFEAMATAAQQLSSYEATRARATQRAFEDERRDIRRRLIVLGLGAGLVIALLLVAANDVVRMALEGDRVRRETPVTRDVILTVSLLLVGGLCARFIAEVARVPEMLVLVGVGAALGPSALDVVDIPFKSLGAQLIFTLGVSAILFYGGLNLSLTILRTVALGLGLLAIPGVILTTVITGAAAHLVFDFSWSEALLIGAVLSPTDPAILIPLFLKSRLRPKVAQTVIAESAFNDPTGAILALAFAGVLLNGESSLSGPAQDFVVNLAISTALGLVAGVLLAAVISSRRAGIWRESSAVAVMTVVSIGYFSLDSAGGSGYLGAFIAGLIVGNMELLGLAMHAHHEREMKDFAGNLADIVTLFVFLLLGANLPFQAMYDDLLPALAVLATLVLVARPITVLACTLPDRGAAWTRRELAFMCWTRETGVVPAALVGVLAGLGVPNNDVFASIVALAILLTLALQALPAGWLAGKLGLLDAPQPAEPVGGIPG